MYRSHGKRMLDLTLSIASLPVTLPCVAGGWIAASLSTGGPGIFRQVRVGRGLRPFSIVKLRTMREGAGPLVTVEGDTRITRVGGLLRRSKLDELPQLWNVLTGEMSIVGPRPEVPTWAEHYPDDFAEALARMKPGLSDLASLIYHDEAKRLGASIDGAELYRSEILPDKLRLYKSYAEHVCLRLDLWIILLTLVSLVRPAWAGDQALRLAIAPDS